MVTMWHKDYGDVEVFDIKSEGNKLMAICYIPTFGGHKNSQGWTKIKVSKLIPYPHAEIYKTGRSKTEYNKIKSMLKLTYAEWTCTDGSVYDHRDLKKAIQHQAQLIEEEKNNE